MKLPDIKLPDLDYHIHRFFENGKSAVEVSEAELHDYVTQYVTAAPGAVYKRYLELKDKIHERVA